MSSNDYIINFLHLQDSKIRILNVNEETIDNIVFTVIDVEREIEPHVCTKCSSNNVNILNYYKRTIKYLDCFGYNCLIKYKQRRFVCKECSNTFNENCYLVQKNKNISNATIQKLLEECRTKQSFKDIAKNTNISLPTAISYFMKHVSDSRNTLTEVLCFDEFRANTKAGKYAFIIGDPISGEIIDVIGDRTQDYLYDYFNKIPLEERLKVKYIVTDLFEPYKPVIHNCFWKSIHIADRFHWIRIATNSFNNLRVRLMKYYLELGKKLYGNKYNKYTTYAIRLKKYWKFLLKNRYQMKHESYDKVVYNYTFKKNMSINDIIEYLVNSDSKLEEGYLLLQDVYRIAKEENFNTIKEKLQGWIDKATAQLENLPEFKDAVTAYRNWFSEICNSFIVNPITGKRMTNGFIEGKNNFCKVIKRVGFGYKNFEIFRSRILYTNSKKLKPYKN